MFSRIALTWVLGSLPFLGLFAMAIMLFLPEILQRLLVPSRTRRGSYVCEVYLDWEICRGSTLYRQRFSSEQAALRSAKIRAWILDRCLPSRYRSEDWSGNPIWIEHEFEIKWTVRALAAEERSAFHTVWCTRMPGERGFTGEHREAHPLA